MLNDWPDKLCCENYCWQQYCLGSQMMLWKVLLKTILPWWTNLTLKITAGKNIELLDESYFENYCWQEYWIAGRILLWKLLLAIILPWWRNLTLKITADKNIELLDESYWINDWPCWAVQNYHHHHHLAHRILSSYRIMLPYCCYCYGHLGYWLEQRLSIFTTPWRVAKWDELGESATKLMISLVLKVVFNIRLSISLQLKMFKTYPLNPWWDMLKCWNIQFNMPHQGLSETCKTMWIGISGQGELKNIYLF